MMPDYEAVIGLEIHARLDTRSKLFCSCRNSYGRAANSLTCPVCLGLPGALPALNKKAVEYAVMMILAVKGEIDENSVFARKNYFYPDLPKGYQISQYDRPLGRGGKIRIEIDSKKKYIGLERIHLEEDAGKSIHFDDYSLVDLNRCGVPLIEIVTKPELNSHHEAYLFLIRVRQILRYLGISSGDMEKGEFRCDANISVRPKGHDKFGIKTELKNINSFRFVEKALEYEQKRQVELLESGQSVIQETRLWDEKTGRTMPMRSKEEALDYRYFPEPDLYVLQIDRSSVRRLGESLRELPAEMLDRFILQYNIPHYDAGVLTADRKLAEYFEKVGEECGNPKLAANWIMTEVMRVLKEQKLDADQIPVAPEMLARLLRCIDDEVVSGRTAKEVLAKMIDSGDDPDLIIERENLAQISDPRQLELIIRDVINQEPEKAKMYREGRTQLIGYFVGKVMAKSGGRANPKIVNQLLREFLNE